MSDDGSEVEAGAKKGRASARAPPTKKTSRPEQGRRLPSEARSELLLQQDRVTGSVGSSRLSTCTNSVPLPASGANQIALLSTTKCELNSLKKNRQKKNKRTSKGPGRLSVNSDPRKAKNSGDGRSDASATEDDRSDPERPERDGSTSPKRINLPTGCISPKSQAASTHEGAVISPRRRGPTGKPSLTGDESPRSPRRYTPRNGEKTSRKSLEREEKALAKSQQDQLSSKARTKIASIQVVMATRLDRKSPSDADGDSTGPSVPSSAAASPRLSEVPSEAQTSPTDLVKDSEKAEKLQTLTISVPTPKRKPKMLCMSYMRGNCTNGAGCPYSHGADDSKTSSKPPQGGDGADASGSAPVSPSTPPPSQMSGSQSAAPDEDEQAKKKTKMKCMPFMRGQCENGANCVFSHDISAAAPVNGRRSVLAGRDIPGNTSNQTKNQRLAGPDNPDACAIPSTRCPPACAARASIIQNMNGTPGVPLQNGGIGGLRSGIETASTRQAGKARTEHKPARAPNATVFGRAGRLAGRVAGAVSSAWRGGSGKKHHTNFE
jgi:hypothetical protein